MTAFADTKAALDPLVSNRVTRYQMPPPITFPYITMDDTGGTPTLRGDGRAEAYNILMTVHLWENVESDGLQFAVLDTLNGLRLDHSGNRMRLVVDGWTRVPDPDNSIFHSAFTIHAVVLA